ncbi:lycopene beta-cyclase CrtY [Aquisediminimonas sediminicola]|uniref:lycopene beta-cyclase CrtY n=1 Tax=Alteraquisediminimonas sediminicola TaxID=2676787 RepID=UPI001C8E6DE8|nr:lycopene beta-cyclase CrtY [Aquisediminimonas sediminicola]
MGRTIKCDIAIAGGGLSGCLAALALHQRNPSLDVRLIEQGDTFGGNHLWSFFDQDLSPEGLALITPLISHAWPSYEVRFPTRSRDLHSTYCSIRSEQLDQAVRARLPESAIFTGQFIVDLGPRHVELRDGTRFEARAIIDARGTGDLDYLDLGWQKFVGQEIKVAGGHGRHQPVIMDANIPQIDGYRFVYTLPFTSDSLLVEDTYYADDPTLDHDVLAGRIADYADRHGWHRRTLIRQESGVLPIAMGGDFDGYWQSGGAEVPKIGLRAGLFHPTTGYSLPDAVRSALLIAAQRDFSATALHDLLYQDARARWKERGYYRLLARMLFRAAEPDARFRIMAQFYRLDQRLIERFYASNATWRDKLRILMGRPPVSIWRALGQLFERKKGMR